MIQQQELPPKQVFAPRACGAECFKFAPHVMRSLPLDPPRISLRVVSQAGATLIAAPEDAD
ncbi:hypothetical protein SAMN04488117_10276 [Celeribacter baekdonensis]|uniref:Uncharacterized protein n=1 Tax=Celeribacter baekdonensis TaxID=875171 RepID=A0A1G7HV17_9RHOB|nr:hypothetical protein SAMN04488117_10276 [Celeribacter baekdonensis]